MRRSYYTNERKPKFCTFCGQELVTKGYDDGYDLYTGERSIKEFLVCPKAHLNYDKHDCWEIHVVENIEILGFDLQRAYKP